MGTGLKNVSVTGFDREIALPGGQSFTVKGIALNDIMILVSRRQGELEALFDQYQAALQDVDQRARNITAVLLNSMPDLVADIICIASGGIDDETIKIAKAMPFTSQLEALEAIGELTFTAANPPKKVIETVIRMFQGAQAAVPTALET